MISKYDFFKLSVKLKDAGENYIAYKTKSAG